MQIFPLCARLAENVTIEPTKPSALLPDNKILYNEDFHPTTQQTAELPRAGQFDPVRWAPATSAKLYPV